MSESKLDQTDPKMKLYHEQFSRDLQRLRDIQSTQGQQLTDLKGWVLEHDRTLRGDGPDKPGLIAHQVLIEQKLSVVIENQQADKKMKASIFVVLFGLVAATLWQIITAG